MVQLPSYICTLLWLLALTTIPAVTAVDGAASQGRWHGIRSWWQSLTSRPAASLPARFTFPADSSAVWYSATDLRPLRVAFREERVETSEKLYKVALYEASRARWMPLRRSDRLIARMSVSSDDLRRGAVQFSPTEMRVAPIHGRTPARRIFLRLLDDNDKLMAESAVFSLVTVGAISTYWSAIDPWDVQMTVGPDGVQVACAVPHGTSRSAVYAVLTDAITGQVVARQSRAALEVSVEEESMFFYFHSLPTLASGWYVLHIYSRSWFRKSIVFQSAPMFHGLLPAHCAAELYPNSDGVSGCMFNEAVGSGNVPWTAALLDLGAYITSLSMETRQRVLDSQNDAIPSLFNRRGLHLWPEDLDEGDKLLRQCVHSDDAQNCLKSLLKSASFSSQGIKDAFTVAVQRRNIPMAKTLFKRYPADVHRYLATSGVLVAALWNNHDHNWFDYLMSIQTPETIHAEADGIFYAAIDADRLDLFNMLMALGGPWRLSLAQLATHAALMNRHEFVVVCLNKLKQYDNTILFDQSGIAEYSEYADPLLLAVLRNSHVDVAAELAKRNFAASDSLQALLITLFNRQRVLFRLLLQHVRLNIKHLELAMNIALQCGDYCFKGLLYMVKNLSKSPVVDMNRLLVQATEARHRQLADFLMRRGADPAAFDFRAFCVGVADDDLEILRVQVQHNSKVESVLRGAAPNPCDISDAVIRALGQRLFIGVRS